MDNEIVQQLAFFALNFALILSTLLFYAIFGWVIANWLIMFGILSPMNRAFQFLTQLVMPLLKPFRWARIGMILALDLAMTVMRNVVTQFI